ncbi:MAG TPA: SGNH/GDSL hydrolase family protein [Thermoanaerobaculia bacterium]|nr:SGNH/GDSL hydrolase family protein [Thermoanaerobaculia bacterium]
MKLWTAATAVAAFLAAAAAAAPAKVEIVSADDISVTYRELQPLRLAVDGDLYHRKDCPAVPKNAESIAPGIATLRRLQPHACAVGAKPEYAQFTIKRAPRDPNVIAVLFLGNSLTYFNEIPKITQAISAREKRPLRVDAVTRSGVTLEQLWIDTDARKRLWLTHWDYVILQGGAGAAHPTYNADVFQRYLHMFAAEVRQSGATPLYYMVWRHEEPPNYESASLAAAKRANVRVIPVALAWVDLIRRGRFERLDAGGGHPDAFGAYLVACTVYSTIYGKPAHGTPHDFRHLAAPNETYDAALREQRIDADDARALQEAAWAAVCRIK